MTWVAWRQQRTETVITVGILVLLAALLLPTGLDMASAYHRDGLAACLGPGASLSCQQAIDDFGARFDSLNSLIAWLTLVPGLIGILLAAPFVLQLEHGTYRLDWTQSITRRRWISGKLGLAIAVGLAASLIFTLLTTWWRTPLVHLEGRMDASVFDSEGTVVFAYTLFGLGLALAAGAVWRRAVPALIVGFIGYFAARVFVDTWLRQRFIAPIKATWSASGPAPSNYQHAWVLSEYRSDKVGHPIAPLGSCVSSTGAKKILNPSCVFEKGTGYMHAVYEPASRFWALQGIETAVFGSIALALILFAAVWTNRRAA